MNTMPMPNRILKIVMIITVIVLAAYPAFNNFKYNNHSKNWLNHDYGKNLLSSTQEYSIFMTEGGDNQVFSTLYFTYAEKLRQDLFPYDQKGNIFKKIYGDLRYTYYDVLQKRSLVVNKGLFTGQEPFYVDIRKQDDPYFIPYVLGVPSVYLTWELSNQHLLGDYYYRNYGLMYKVQPIRLAIVDYVEVIQQSPLSEVKQYLEEKLGRSITNPELQQWINQDVADGYIRFTQNTIIFQKNYPKPFTKDPTDTFIIRWNEIPNLRYYDYLSREIVISYSYEQIGILSDKMETLQRLYRLENSPKIKSELQELILANWSKIEEYTRTILDVGYDSVATLHNLGVFYLNAFNKFDHVDEPLTPLAIELWQQALQSAPYAWSTYNIMLWATLKQAIISPKEDREYYLQVFDDQVETMIKNMKHWASMKKNVMKAKPYTDVLPLINARENIQDFSIENFQQTQETIKQSLANGTATPEMVFPYLIKGSQFLQYIDSLDDINSEVDKIWIQTLNRYSNDTNFFKGHLSLLSQVVSFNYFFDEQLFTQTLATADRYLRNPTFAKEQDLNFYISLWHISRATDNPALIQKYRNLLIVSARDRLTPDQFSAFLNRIEQM